MLAVCSSPKFPVISLNSWFLEKQSVGAIRCILFHPLHFLEREQWKRNVACPVLKVGGKTEIRSLNFSSWTFIHRRACLPEPKWSLSVCHCCSPFVSSWCWSSLFVFPHNVSYAVLPVVDRWQGDNGADERWAWAAAGQETDEKRALGAEVEWWKPWAPGCEMWTWCRHLVWELGHHRGGCAVGEARE